MAIKKSEKILGGVSGALLATFAGMFLFGGGGTSLDDLRAELKKQKKTVDEQEVRVRPGKKAAEQLNRWRKRSLPTDYNVAHERYTAWLSGLAVDRVKLHPEITPYKEQQRGYYTVLRFKVEGTGTLDQLTRFLFEFYSAGYLHKVRHLSIKPTKDSQKLKLTIDVEALCLPEAVHQKELPKKQPPRLELAKLNAYHEAIVQRNMEKEGDGYRTVDTGGLFASYSPKPKEPGPTAAADPPETQEAPGIDASAHTYVNAINEVAGLPEVWLFVRMEDRTLVLHEGDPFEVGKMSGTVLRIRIDELDIEIEVDGRHELVAWGKNLREGVEVPE